MNRPTYRHHAHSGEVKITKSGVAQTAERRAHTPVRAGAIPAPATIFCMGL